MTKKTTIRTLIDKTQEYLASDTLELIEDAYEFVSQSCPGGVEHALNTAVIIAELQLDEHCIAAALLHEVPVLSEVTVAEIEEKFDPEVAKLVEGVRKLAKISWPEELKPKKGASDIETHADSLRKMLVAMSEDIRVVFIKLACRLHRTHILKRMPPAKRYAVAQETMEIYAPVAHRLGMWQIEWQLEDLSFRYLEPKRYRDTVHLIAARREEREKYTAMVTKILQDEMAKAGIGAEVTGRAKSICSINRKMEKYAEQGKEFSDIYDLMGFRILVNEMADCYSALGVVHNLWHPLPKEFNDYIVQPREGVYQALHTTVMCLGTTPLEIQIRTREMHRVAEYGIAAHWRYKEGIKQDGEFEERLAVLRQLLDWYKDVGGAEFVESISTDVLGDRVLVYTPQGDIKDLPASSTPLDFAYRVHTELGHRCIGAKVNGKMVPLTYSLQNGDTVEILATKKGKGPSRDWLNPALGYVNTSHAREKVRQWFRKQERSDNIQRGQELLEKELRRLGISISEEELADLFKRDSVEDFFAAIGYGDISCHHIATRLAVQKEKPLPKVAPPQSGISSAVQVMGVGDLLTNLAPCCNPVPGDEIIGYVTRTKGISVHRKDCSNIANIDEKERLIKVEWGPRDELYSVPVHIEALNRVGLLRDISAVVAEEGVNIAAASIADQEDHITSVLLTLQTKGVRQLSRLFSKMEGVRGVISVTRHT
jgi:guanosine-3',5'-bis(diphosphate) 3'-pyrophosphohydrolase